MYIILIIEKTTDMLHLTVIDNIVLVRLG
jgi:hypothetical protein